MHHGTQCHLVRQQRRRERLISRDVTCHTVNVEAIKVDRKITIHQYTVSKHVACVLSCEFLTFENLSRASQCIVFVDFISSGRRILYTGALRVGS